MSAEEKWLNEFNQYPVSALNRLLTGRCYIGRFQSLGPAGALRQLFSQREINRVDTALTEWFSIMINDATIKPTKRLSSALMDAIFSIQELSLLNSKNWCIEHQDQLRSRLSSFKFGSTRDPAATIELLLKPS